MELDVLLLMAFMASVACTAVMFVVGAAASIVAVSGSSNLNSFLSSDTAAAAMASRWAPVALACRQFETVAELTLAASVISLITLGIGALSVALLNRYRQAQWQGRVTPSEAGFGLEGRLPLARQVASDSDRRDSRASTADFLSSCYSGDSSHNASNPLVLRPFNHREDTSEGGGTEGYHQILPPSAARVDARPADMTVVEPSRAATVVAFAQPQSPVAHLSPATSAVDSALDDRSPLARRLTGIDLPNQYGGVGEDGVSAFASRLGDGDMPTVAVSGSVDPYRSVLLCARLQARGSNVIGIDEVRRFHTRVASIRHALHKLVKPHGYHCVLLRRETHFVMLAIRWAEAGGALPPSHGTPAVTVPHVVWNCIMCEAMTLIDDPTDISQHTFRCVAMHVGHLELTKFDDTAVYHGPAVEVTENISRVRCDHSRCLATEAFITDCNPRYFLTAFKGMTSPIRAAYPFLQHNEIAVAVPVEFVAEDLGIGLRLYDVAVEGLDDFDVSCSALGRFLDRFDVFAEQVRTGAAALAMQSYNIMQSQMPVGLVWAAKHLLDSMQRAPRGTWHWTFVEPVWSIDFFSSPSDQSPLAMSLRKAEQAGHSHELSGPAKGREMLRRSTTASGGLMNDLVRRPSAVPRLGPSRQVSMSRAPVREEDGTKLTASDRLKSPRRSPSTNRLLRRDTANHGAMLVRDLEAAQLNRGVKRGVSMEFDHHELSLGGSDALEDLPPSSFTDQWSASWSRSDKMLGQGATANVYLGMNAITGELVAIKCVPVAFFDDHEKVRAFGAEVEKLVSLRHANIVLYRSFAVFDSSWALVVMEYVSGGTLQTLADTFGALSESVVARYLHDIFSGLEFLHTRGVMHQDIKPQNVLLALDGTCKLSDFGTAHGANDGEVQGGTVRGSPLYMAPEQARGHPELATDIWGAGLIAVALLRGGCPYQESELLDATAMSLVLRIGSGDPSLRPVITGSAEMQDLLSSCFEQDPAKRATASSLLKHPLFAAAQSKVFRP